MTINYKIKFLDFFNVASGESGGARLDMSVIRDNDGFVFIPARTIKGVLREIAADFNENDFIKDCFGDAKNPSQCHFANATLSDETKREIKAAKLTPLLYSKVASTALEDGVVKKGSLREIEVAKPMEFYAAIDNVPQIHAEAMRKTLQSLRRMGLNRNRGFGRLKIEICEVENA